MTELTQVRAAVEARFEASVALLRELVQVPSVLGDEEGAQVVVERRLRELGFAVRSVEPDAARLAEIPASGIPLLPYAGRRCLIGELPGAGEGVIALNGHVDVVSPEPVELWSTPPYGAVERDGRLYGRGAVDMKGGIAAMLLAIEAARSLGPLPATVVYQSVIEEEITGNGAIAAQLAGPRADVALIAEPSGGNVTLAGVGVITARITLTGESGHALSSDLRRNPIDEAYHVIGALRELERELNASPDATFADVEHPYLLNVGALHSGDWPSTSPGKAELDVRLGFPVGLAPAEAQARLAATVRAASPNARVEFRGQRAEGYAFDAGTPFVRLLRSCHEELHGVPAIVDTARATTDLRFFRDTFPTAGAACYGPTGARLHGADEYVELASIKDVATVMALVLRRWRPEVGE
ncbi:ArgE/DapE family deacylase [Conexibacter woesei]|nr:ArgE/DapE family deacylase [Conexibacter woesei]